MGPEKNEPGKLLITRDRSGFRRKNEPGNLFKNEADTKIHRNGFCGVKMIE
jgi:hypothetical protein